MGFIAVGEPTFEQEAKLYNGLIPIWVMPHRNMVIIHNTKTDKLEA